MQNQVIYEDKTAYFQINRFIYSTYSWMTLGILITTFASMLISNSPTMLNLIYSNRIFFYVLVFGELGLVIYISAALSKISYQKASALFILYSALNGATLAYIFVVYTASSIVATFLVSSLTFGVMAVYGFFTKTDLTKVGNILFMALIGMIIATFVNIFLKNSGLSLILTYVGVLIFCGLVAYDTQYLKRLSQSIDSENENYKKLALFGALKLYLDFINLFLLFLRIFGSRRN